MITDNYETQPNHFFAAISGRQLLPTWYLKLFIDLQLQPFFYYQQLALRNSTKQSYLKHPLSLRPRLIHSLLKPHFRGSVGGNVSIKQSSKCRPKVLILAHIRTFDIFRFGDIKMPVQSVLFGCISTAT